MSISEAPYGRVKMEISFFHLIPDVISPINTEPVEKIADKVLSGCFSAPPLLTMKVIPRMS